MGGARQLWDMVGDSGNAEEMMRDVSNAMFTQETAGDTKEEVRDTREEVWHIRGCQGNDGVLTKWQWMTSLMFSCCHNLWISLNLLSNLNNDCKQKRDVC